ncbi:MAG: gliding motility-associated C-terminal domain-containing protein, partial [Cyclobacteriaceae bacterium]|nr:gliding motility-associated C-terminal domain-containing protein [Cyclobacteriaceae bacterium HetDA_MAG_MS6]
KCFEFTVTNITPGETISFRAEPVNFEGHVDDIFTVKQQFVGSGVDTLLIEVCAPGCPPLGEDPFIIDLIAADDACPLPQLDTLRLTMQVEPPSNALPISDLVSGSIIVDENDVFVRDFVGTDADDHLMYFALTVEGVENPSEIGLTLETTSSVAGDIGGRLTWDTNCLENDFAESQVFRVGLRVEDLDECDYENPNVIWLDLEVILPPNTNPEVSFLSTSITEIDVTYGDILEYTAVIDDADDDQVSLILAGKEFVPTDFGVQFNPSSGQGKASSNFRWDIDCGLFNLLGEETYTFYFIGDDTDKCQVKNFDTLTLVVNLSQPVNNQPLILEQPDYRLKVNEPFSLLMIANDMDVDDVISLSFFDGARLPSSSSLRFPGATGKGTVSSTLEWTPECNLINPDGSSKTYELVFLATDDICPISKFDTDTITFEIFQDRENFERFLPPNVFTPNGDDVNEVFSMTNLDEPLSDLPIDNCDDRFEYVSIHDRAGKRVFFSETRDFRWDGGDFPVGTYFYVVKYQRTEYNGYVQLVR